MLCVAYNNYAVAGFMSFVDYAVYFFYKWTGAVHIGDTPLLQLIIYAFAYSVGTYYYRCSLTALKAVNGLDALGLQVGIYVFIVYERGVGYYFSGMVYFLLAGFLGWVYSKA